MSDSSLSRRATAAAPGMSDLLDAGSKVSCWAMQTDRPFRLVIEMSCPTPPF